MAKFSVRITRFCEFVETLDVEVEAESPEAAQEAVEERHDTGTYDEGGWDWDRGDEDVTETEFEVKEA